MGSLFLEKYKEDAVESLMQMNPDWDRKEVEKIVNQEMKKSFQNPDVEIDNNYTRNHTTTKLLTVMDWSLENEPIVAGNGTFYKNQHQAENPVAEMLDGFLKKRKAIKKQMFGIEDKRSDKYRDLDLSQGIMKVNANS